MNYKIKIVLVLLVLAVAAPAVLVAAPSTIVGFANFISGLSAPMSLTGSEVVGVVQSGITRKLSLSALSTYVAGQQSPTTTVQLSGTAPVPAGSHLVNASPGSNLTLPAGASPGTTEYVSDYQSGAGTSAINVAPSSDAPIVGVTGSYSLTVSGQLTGFMRTSNATWQIF